MTLQHLRYMLAIAEYGSIKEAARRLSLSQPSLSTAVRDLEKDLGFCLFTRSPKGVDLTREGLEFMGYARQVVQQQQLLEQRYLSGQQPRQQLSVSAPHYSLAATAFVKLIEQTGGDNYDFSLQETTTQSIIENVKMLQSEIGVLCLCSFNAKLASRLLKESNIRFEPLCSLPPTIFVRSEHPLSAYKTVCMADLRPYTNLIYEQGVYSSSRFAHENSEDQTRHIFIADRASALIFLKNIDAYTIGTTQFSGFSPDDGIVAVPLDADEVISVGIIRHKSTRATPLGIQYEQILRSIVEQPAS